MNFNLLSSCLIFSSLIAVPSIAQINSIDDLPNDTTQMKTWYCNDSDQSILVKVKMVDNWRQTMNIQQWQCTEELLGGIPHNPTEFSCESDENQINLITVTWLKGNEGKTPMQNWITAFEQKNMTCTVDQTNPFWQ